MNVSDLILPGFYIASLLVSFGYGVRSGREHSRDLFERGELRVIGHMIESRIIEEIERALAGVFWQRQGERLQKRINVWRATLEESKYIDVRNAARAKVEKLEARYDMMTDGERNTLTIPAEHADKVEAVCRDFLADIIEYGKARTFQELLAFARAEIEQENGVVIETTT